MDLLTRTFRSLRRFLGPDAWFSYGVLAVLVTLEIAGRRVSTSDFYDLLTVMVLMLLAWLVAVRHRQRPLGWVNLAVARWERVRTFFHSRGIDVGVDFRGAPPLPRSLPPSVLRTVGALLLWAALLLPFLPNLPHGLRFLGERFFYLGYLAVLVALWGALALSVAMAAYLPWAIIHDAFVSRFDGPGRRSLRRELIALGAYFGGLLIAARFLPPWFALAICGLALTINLVTMLIPANPDVKFVWRYRESGSVVRSIPWPQYVLGEFSVLTLGTINLVLTSCGGAIFGDVRSAYQDMPITTGIGMLLAWLAPGALVMLVIQSVLGRLRDPARPARPVVHIRGAELAAQRAELHHFFALRGWAVRFAPAPVNPLDVCVELAESAEPDSEAAWPLRVSAEALQSDAVFQRLARRDEIQKRRRLVSGLERLFKNAARHRYRCGSGFWIAPHYWFVLGLTRDMPEEDLDLGEGTLLTGIVGPPYHRVIPRAARHHAYQILRALQIDLVFVEDGVGFRRFLRILRMMFEVYDIHGGRRKANEVNFHGVPGTRVLIHEFVLQEPFRSEVYPEPEYENLGRARILHIFRDRGEQEERLDIPRDFSHMPVPSLAR
jgi:hypothetical protein